MNEKENPFNLLDIFKPFLNFYYGLSAGFFWIFSFVGLFLLYIISQFDNHFGLKDFRDTYGGAIITVTLVVLGCAIDKTRPHIGRVRAKRKKERELRTNLSFLSNAQAKILCHCIESKHRSFKIEHRQEELTARLTELGFLEFSAWAGWPPHATRVRIPDDVWIFLAKKQNKKLLDKLIVESKP